MLKGTRLVIPSALRNDIHEGHQGIVKCRERASQRVWWPGLSQQLNELVFVNSGLLIEIVNITLSKATNVTVHLKSILTMVPNLHAVHFQLLNFSM